MATRTHLLGAGLAAWCVAFACVHMAWAAGWRGGLPDSFEPISERPGFLAYDIVAGLLMYAAAVGALLLASGRGTPLLRRATLVAAVASLLRGAPALVFDAMDGAYDLVGFGADVWFTISGIAGVVLWSWTRLSPTTPSTAPAPGQTPRRVGPQPRQ